MNAKRSWMRFVAAAGVTLIATAGPVAATDASPADRGTQSPGTQDLLVQVVPLEQVRHRVEPRLVRRPVSPDLVRRRTGRRALRVRVWTSAGDGSLVFPGEDMRVHFRVNRSAYVVVYDIDTRGRVRLLFPEFPGDDGYVRGGRTLRIPGRRAGYRLMVTGPPGVERIVALASNRPLVGRWRRIARREGLLDAACVPAPLVPVPRVQAEGDVVLGAAGFHAGFVAGPQPNLVRSPLRPRLIRVPSRRRILAWDETWFEVGSRWWR